LRPDHGRPEDITSPGGTRPSDYRALRQQGRGTRTAAMHVGWFGEPPRFRPVDFQPARPRRGSSIAGAVQDQAGQPQIVPSSAGRTDRAPVTDRQPGLGVSERRTHCLRGRRALPSMLRSSASPSIDRVANRRSCGVARGSERAGQAMRTTFSAPTPGRRTTRCRRCRRCRGCGGRPVGPAGRPGGARSPAKPSRGMLRSSAAASSGTARIAVSSISPPTSAFRRPPRRVSARPAAARKSASASPERQHEACHVHGERS
jgi:hypothetical protein